MSIFNIFKNKKIKKCSCCGRTLYISDDDDRLIYAKDRDLKLALVCSKYCKEVFIKNEISELKYKISWLKAELED